MRKKVYVFLVFVVSILLPIAAFATSIDQTIKLILPNDNSEYNLNGGSSFNTLTISSTYFTFEIAAGGSVELVSQDKKKFSNDGGYSTTCNTNDSRLIMSIASGGTTKTVVVTPSGTCTSGSTTGGGGDPSIGSTAGGGGGGGISPTPAPVPTPISTTTLSTTTPSITPTPAPIPTPSLIQLPPGANVPGTVSAFFNQDLSIGQSGNDISRLQGFLASDKKIYPEGIVSGYFGPATQRAVKRFQAKYGLAQVGRAGPQTRAKLKEIFGKDASLSPVSAPESSTPPLSDSVPSELSVLFDYDLAYGMRNDDDVRRLQQLLASNTSFYPEGIVSGYFGPATQRAVKRFQAKYGLAQVGRAGPQTRAKLKEVFGQTIPPPPATAPFSPPASVEDASIKRLQDQLKALQDQLNAIQGVQ